jgi:hypothetical protein
MLKKISGMGDFGSHLRALVRQRTIPSDRRLSAKLVPTSADKGYRVVSATNPHGR